VLLTTIVKFSARVDNAETSKKSETHSCEAMLCELSLLARLDDERIYGMSGGQQFLETDRVSSRGRTAFRRKRVSKVTRRKSITFRSE